MAESSLNLNGNNKTRWILLSLLIGFLIGTIYASILPSKIPWQNLIISSPTRNNSTSRPKRIGFDSNQWHQAVTKARQCLTHKTKNLSSPFEQFDQATKHCTPVLQPFIHLTFLHSQDEPKGFIPIQQQNTKGNCTFI